MTEEANKQQATGEQQPEQKAGQVNGAPAPAAWNGRLPLRKTVIANGESVNEITFREPTGADIERVGNPITVGLYENQPKVHFEAQTMTQMMSALAGVPPSTIRQMHPRDWNNGAWLLANFFMPDL